MLFPNPMYHIRKNFLSRWSIGKRLPPTSRRLRLEPLEDRRLLSITVDTLVDEADGSIVDGDVSLRDAIAAAPAGETIDFSVTGMINLSSLGELTISKSLTIDGPGAEVLTIKAYDPSPASSNSGRVFNIDDGTNGLTDVEIAGLTLTGGRTNSGGGAIRSSENLVVTDSVITGNQATVGGGIHTQSGSATITNTVISENHADEGGGVHIQNGSLTIAGSTLSNNSAKYGGGIGGDSGDVTISGSVINDNRAFADGGGIWQFSADLSVHSSTISGNMADRNGGGIDSEGSLTVTASTISDNHAAVSFSFGGGGGIRSLGPTTIVDSTISGNTASVGGGLSQYGPLDISGSTINGNTAETGGGIFVSNLFGTLQITVLSSTISGNIASEAGGGLAFVGSEMTADVRHSTITNNQAPTDMAGGIASSAAEAGTQIDIASSIIADNPSGSDLQFTGGVINPFVSMGFNLVGSGNGSAAFSLAGGDQIGASAMLAPFADNGGPTMTHALTAGSPAIDMGDPAAVAGMGNTPLYDQRGNPFTRVYGGRIDVGAFELQSSEPALPGDYDRDNDVDQDDYLYWKQHFGLTVPAFSGADGNGNGMVDAADYTVWRDNLGSMVPSTVSLSLAALESDNAAAPVSEFAEAAAFHLTSLSVSPDGNLSRHEIRRQLLRRFVGSVDRALESLLVQQPPFRQRANQATTIEDGSHGALSAREEVFADFGAVASRFGGLETLL
jgi:Planctomycete extracellular